MIFHIIFYKLAKLERFLPFIFLWRFLIEFGDFCRKLSWENRWKEKQKTKSEVLTDFLTFEVFDSFLEEICKIEVQPVSSPDPQGPSDPKVDKLEVDIEEKNMVLPGHIDPEKQRFPYCIVWTPIPFLT